MVGNIRLVGAKKILNVAINKEIRKIMTCYDVVQTKVEKMGTSIINFVKVIASIEEKAKREFLWCFLLILILVSCPGCLNCFSPPDLSECTRIEISYHPSALSYFVPSTTLQNSILSSNEKDYLESTKTFIVTDRRLIEEFAHSVSLGKYAGFALASLSLLNPVYIDCYCNSKHTISFGVFSDIIITKDRRKFKYPTDLRVMIEPPEMQTFKLRFYCAWHMQRLYTAGPLSRKSVSSYPEPDRWCDIILRERTNTSYVSEDEMIRIFKCPSAGEGKCHYAMNPNCKPDSSLYTVLLFETKSGWNQHGGPELFTFDNHDPNGGCVLLNDGTVKFIRTKEELQQLRWK